MWISLGTWLRVLRWNNVDSLMVALVNGNEAEDNDIQALLGEPEAAEIGLPPFAVEIFG